MENIMKKTFNASEHTPTNPRNNCLCDSGTPCYYHIKKQAWFSKYKDEQIFPTVWSYALLPSTPTASFENMLMVLCQFGVNTFKQEFSKMSPEKQEELNEEWQFTNKSLRESFE